MISEDVWSGIFENPGSLLCVRSNFTDFMSLLLSTLMEKNSGCSGKELLWLNHNNFV